MDWRGLSSAVLGLGKSRDVLALAALSEKLPDGVYSLGEVPDFCGGAPTALAWAARVAQNSPEVLRMGKIQMNKAQDAQGFTQALEDSLGDYCAMMWMPGVSLRMEGENRLLAVDLAVRGKRGTRQSA